VPEESSPNSLFDPKDKNVSEVQEHLDASDQEERERVWAAESEGKNRPTIMNYEPADGEDEPEKPENSDAEGNEGELSEEAKEERKEELEAESEKAAGGDVPEGYDPHSDPLVPSSTLADSIAVELASGEGSATLQALHDNKPDEDAPKKDDKSTS
jgi:hypothetical protein